MRDTQTTVSARLSHELSSAVEAKLEQSQRSRVIERLNESDPTLWGPAGTPEIANRLGWLSIAERMLGQLGAVEAFADQIASEGFTDVVLLGMGGSSLAAEVMRRSFGERAGRPRLRVLDSTDAEAVSSLERAIEPERTLFLVSSKSGGTIEPLSMFAYFHALVESGDRFVAITDPDTGLAELARERGFRHTFLGDPDIGGRYSALSPFGVVPAALAGVDVRALLEGSRGAMDTIALDGEAEHPAPVWLGAALSALAQAGRDKLTFVVCESLPGLGLWLEQLFAESTGKRGRGILPIAQEPLGDARVYGEDRVFAHLVDLAAPDEPTRARLDALADAGHPVITIPTRGALDLGRLFLLSEIAVAVAGWGLELNPFDQPNVQQAKDATKRVLAAYTDEHELPSLPDADPERLRSLLAGARPGEYVALLGYLAPSSAFDAQVAELRGAIGKRTGAATTFGYGPRYLHSTGQFHKGGPRSGRFLQLVHDGPVDVEIPGSPYTFDVLKHAQAIGDLETLRELELPAERVRLAGEDPVAALRKLTDQIKEAL